jgi:hypothetical protein
VIVYKYSIITYVYSCHYKVELIVCLGQGGAMSLSMNSDPLQTKGVFGLTFGFGFCLPKSQKPTKRLDSGSSFF